MGKPDSVCNKVDQDLLGADQVESYVRFFRKRMEIQSDFLLVGLKTHHAHHVGCDSVDWVDLVVGSELLLLEHSRIQHHLDFRANQIS